MKFIHLADLHIGKRVGEFNMIEDQKFIHKKILEIIQDAEPDAVILAGDIYDKSVPSGEAVEILDNFLTEIAARKVQLYIVSGNHDSAERLNFGSRIMQQNGVNIAGTFSGEVKHLKVNDKYGPINIFLLPFVKPAIIRSFFIDKEIDSYETAVKAVIDSVTINEAERNVLIAHQFITSGNKQPEQSESETISIGGLDNIDTSVFDPFDYVALGHLHKPQSIGRSSIRYCGSPLKYSFSETYHNKSATIIEMHEKGKVDIKTIPLIPLRDMREIKGPIEELITTAKTTSDISEDYIHATITNEEEIYDAIGQLRQVYPNIMRIDFENSRTKIDVRSKTAASGDVILKSPMELFCEFYTNQNNVDMNEDQKRIMQEIFEQIGGVVV